MARPHARAAAPWRCRSWATSTSTRRSRPPRGQSARCQSADPRPSLDERRKVRFPSEPFRRDYAIETADPEEPCRGLLAGRSTGWTSTGPAGSASSATFSRTGCASGCASSSAAPTPRRSRPRRATFSRDSATLWRSVAVEPAKAKEIEDAVVAVAADLSANGATQDELDRTKNPTLTSLREKERTNEYWISVLSRAQERPGGPGLGEVAPLRFRVDYKG